MAENEPSVWNIIESPESIMQECTRYCITFDMDELMCRTTIAGYALHTVIVALLARECRIMAISRS